ncbi:hypothetical protein BJ912DRAFT_968312 [Pholiota molesta]|nr:hypothetical protein BJ912DRAFT_968312 [Pholiota molesta]
MTKLSSITLDTKKSEISSTINSSMLLMFGMGMYTVIYFGTMYIYLTRRLSKHRLVPATITILFLCNIIQISVQWYVTKWQFVDNGDNRDSVFVSLFDGLNWTYLALEIPSYIGFVLADLLLLWRCFHVWNRSFRVISVPLILAITETALFCTKIAIPLASIPDTSTKVVAAAFFTTSATSFVTTVLIAYRIYSTAKHEGVSGRRFKHIIDIIVQSGAVYSLSLLQLAILYHFDRSFKSRITGAYELNKCVIRHGSQA